MSTPRNRFALQAALGAGALLSLVAPSSALDAFWQGDTGTPTTWNTASNWFVSIAPGDGGFVPQASGGFNTRAIIGSDRPNAALNTIAGNNSPVISAALTPVAKATIGGLYLGLRELDYTVAPPALLNPAPDAGALVGALTISGGTLNNVATSDAASGADGRILVGADGRGFLTMTGGTLTGQALIVAGENYTADALGTSLVDLSGSSTLTISNAVPSSGLATFSRRLRVTGPDVNFSSTGTLRLNSTNSYTAVITSPTAHSPLKTNSTAIIGGALNVEFSGAGAVGHVLGETWDLVDAGTAMAGNFNNLGVGGDVPVSGLAVAPPTGAVYRLKRSTAGNGHKLLQLSYEATAVLVVNRDTGEIKITNPLGGDVAMDGYTVASSLGSMNTSFHGISGTTPTPPSPNWQKYGPTVNALTEVINDPSNSNSEFGILGVAQVSIGNGFNRTAVAGNANNFGTDGEDLVFTFTRPGVESPIRGQVIYTGTKFENNLVLRVNPTTGVAFLKNDSQETLVLDGYALTSSTGALSGGGFTGLGAGWVSSPASANALTQTNLAASTTLAPGAQLAIGDISATGFSTTEAQNGLGLQFLLANSIAPAGLGGDYNDDGLVNAADYTIFRDNEGATFTLTNENPNAATPGVVDKEDYDYWTSQYGLDGSTLPETTFRVGSILFDPTAGASSAVSVPEPTGLVAMVAGMVLSLTSGWRRRPVLETQLVHANSRRTDAMPTRRPSLTPMLTAIAIAALVTPQAMAVTQGIPLTNSDFELPGPANQKFIAFNDDGSPNGGIPGWTFPGPGLENFGHETTFGDSGTEGGGNPGNEMLLSMLDGIAYQTSAFNVVSIPATQKYRLSFDAQDVFTIDAENVAFETSQNQLTARVYYLAPDNVTRTTIGAPLVISGLAERQSYSIEFVGGAAALTPALGRPIGVEFDVTSNIYNPLVAHSWAGIDNVVMQITGVTAGDLNGDGLVNNADYNIVVANQQTASFFNANGELTGDGLVNLNDFRAFKTILAAASATSTVPEPTTVAMLLGGIVALGFGRVRRASVLVVAVTAGALSSQSASAEVLAYDPFLIGSNPAAGEYTVGNLTGQNPIIGPTPFFNGPWSERPGGVDMANNGEVKLAPGLSFLGAPALGGSVGPVADETTFATQTRVGRYFANDQRWTGSTVGTYYVGWLQNFGTIPNSVGDMGFRATEFWSEAGTVGVDSTAVGYIGYNAYYSALPEPIGGQQRAPSTARMTFAFGGQHQIIENSPSSFNEDGATHLIVLKFVLSDQADSDTISVYLDPVSLTEPELAGATLVNTNITVGALGFSLFGGAGATLPTFDELRVATTWAEAVVDFPLPGDTDNDGDVDMVDYQNIVSNMNQLVGSSLLGDVAKADGTQGADGRVTIADYRLWRDNRTDIAPATSDVVPEPTALGLVALAVLAAFGRRTDR